MPNPYFKFKRFTVYHDRCAMKVGTDGVLIGIWTNIDSAERVLDVGSGSGLVALMLAQRSDNSQIDAIEIDKEAALQCAENFERSSFVNLSGCSNISYQDFAATNRTKYDLIVSNPPFFSRSLKSPDVQRTAARHTDSLLIEDFVQISKSLLSDKGRISFVFPAAEKDCLLQLASQNNLFVSRLTTVLPTPVSEPKRILIELSVQECPTIYSELVIETERHVYSLQFIDLAKDFYLKL